MYSKDELWKCKEITAKEISRCNIYSYDYAKRLMSNARKKLGKKITIDQFAKWKDISVDLFYVLK